MNSPEYNKAYWEHLKSDPERYELYKDKARVRNKVWYQENKEKNHAYHNERHRKRKLDAVAYLGGSCVKCGGVFHPSVYDFHHVNPDEKEYGPSVVLRLSWEKAKAELDKCVLLCANCHRLVHFAGEEYGQ